MLAGSTNTGKTCFLRRHRTGEFEKLHVPTMGAEVAPLVFYTTHGPVCFKVWDLAGDERYKGFGEGYYEGAQGLLAFYDLERLETVKQALTVINAHPGIPAVLCGNKADLFDKVGMSKYTPPGATHCKVSARTSYNFDKPFLVLARALMGEPLLEFAEAPALAPPTIPVDPGLMCLRNGKDFSALRFKKKYELGQNDSYDGFGESLRCNLEELLEDAGCAGYRATINVTVKFDKP